MWGKWALVVPPAACKLAAMKIHAHSLRDRDESLWELLSDHLARVGELAGEFARPFGGEEIARAEGLLHDIGKCAAAYQKYIRELGSSPDHSTAGAFEAFQRYGPLFGRLMAFAIAGHHAGLADGTGDDGPGRSLEARLKDAGSLPDYAGWQAHIPQLTGQVALSRKLAATGNTAFSLAFLGRMLFSCLVDADFLATEEFYAEARGEKIERGGHGTIEALRARLDIHMAKLAAAAGRTPLNALRAEILAHARGQAALAPGLFTMTVPTGGGKTLASLAFALDHAVAHGLRRVIYVIPYTSIIEQTAGIFREALGDANVLEHHGNFDWERTPNTEEQGQADAEAPDGLRKLRRAAGVQPAEDRLLTGH